MSEKMTTIHPERVSQISDEMLRVVKEVERWVGGHLIRHKVMTFRKRATPSPCTCAGDSNDE